MGKHLASGTQASSFLYSLVGARVVTSTEGRIRQLVREHLDITRDLDFDASFGQSDISSMDVVAFAKLVGQEFGFMIPPGDFAQIQNLRGLADYLDAHAD